MPAEFTVNLDTGGTVGNPGLETNTDSLGPPNIRYKNADDPNIDNNDINFLPSVGTNRSRWKQNYLKCIQAPDTQVDNVRIYTDGSGYGLGITVEVGNETPVKNSGSNAGYDPSDINNESLTNHSGITGVVDLFTFTDVSPKPVTISEFENKINAIGQSTDYVVTQMEITPAASTGVLTAKNFTFAYDEV